MRSIRRALGLGLGVVPLRVGMLLSATPPVAASPQEAGATGGSTILVPADFTTIQAALNAAGSGDTVLVAFPRLDSCRVVSWTQQGAVVPESSPEITQVLHLMQSAPAEAKNARARLFSLVYQELRTVAASLMRSERPDHTLRPTALVHEAYLRLVGAKGSWNSRSHFFGTAARAMRQILVEHARRHQSIKRGGDRQRVTLDEGLGAAGSSIHDVLALHEALEKLGRLNERVVQVVEMRAFAGLQMNEIAEAIGVSKRTIEEDWSFARRWLRRELN